MTDVDYPVRELDLRLGTYRQFIIIDVLRRETISDALSGIKLINSYLKLKYFLSLLRFVVLLMVAANNLRYTIAVRNNL